jgi:hypothetical protein
MAERQVFIDRVKGAERECHVVADAVSYFGLVALADRGLLPPRTSPRDLDAAIRQVESTYFVRMWSEFETALRTYRRHRTGDPDDQIRTKNLDRSGGRGQTAPCHLKGRPGRRPRGPRASQFPGA